MPSGAKWDIMRSIRSKNPRSSHESARRYLVPSLLVGLIGFQVGSWRGQGNAPEAADEDFHPGWATKARYNRSLWVLDTDSALGRLNLHPKQLSLRDLARLHGHLCDGLVISWVELSAALRELFPRGVIDRTDLRVVAKNGPCWVDATSWMTGARVNHGTLALDNAVGNGFILQRISTGQAVRVRLQPGVFPEDLAELERSIRSRRAAGRQLSAREIDRFEALADEFSHWLLNNPPEKLIEIEHLSGYSFPAESPNLIAPRSDIINRDLARSDPRSQGGEP